MSMQQGTGGKRREEKPPGKVQNQHVTLRSSSCVCWTMIDGVETGESDAGRESTVSCGVVTLGSSCVHKLLVGSRNRRRRQRFTFGQS